MTDTRAGFDESGRPHPGVHPQTGARMTVTFEGLIKEFGVREGIAKYEAIARLEGDMVDPVTLQATRGRYFFDPAVERNYRPDLCIATLPKAAREAANVILTEAQTVEAEEGAEREPKTQAEEIALVAEEGRTIPSLTSSLTQRRGIPVKTETDDASIGETGQSSEAE